MSQKSSRLDHNTMASSPSADQEAMTQVNGLDHDLEPGNLLHVDHKPRLLLMGLKRFAMFLLLDNCFYTHYRPQEWEVVNIECCFS